MATPPVSLRITDPTLLKMLEWLRERDQKQSDFLRDWLESGFALWLVKTAILDPGLYAEIVGGTGDLAQAEALRSQGMEALRDTLQVLVSGIGGFQAIRSGTANRDDQADAGELASDDQAEGLEMFLDFGDPTEML